MSALSDDYLFVVAIDFGTTYSGYAFSSRDDFKKDPLKISSNQAWNAGSARHFSLKTPTCLLLNDKEEFVSFGYEAENRYSEIAMDHEQNEYLFFQRFKMQLYKNKNIKGEMIMEDITGKSVTAMKVFALSIKALMQHLFGIFDERGLEIEKKEIRWVLTVPAIWSDAAKQFMRKSANMAGIKDDQLIIALEPEAASIYCQYLPIEKLSGAEKGFSMTEDGTQYMVVDNGDVHVRNYRESSEENTRAKDILHELQGICLHEHHFKTVKELKKDTQAILNSLSVYKEVVKMNRQVTYDIKWIMKESHGEKEISRILRLLTQDVKGICGMAVVKDCTDVQKTTQNSGVYKIYPDKSGSVKAYCDMAPETGGGWTVIQRRYDGSVNFQRTWSEYENGFGNVNSEYWLGNKYIHRLTSTGTYELKVVLTGSSDKIRFALYRTFVVGNAESKYKLTVGDFSGTAGDSLKYHNGMKFSTTDQDNDRSSGKCVSNDGPWWHNSCKHSGLNIKFSSGLYWAGFDSKCTKSVMMIRRIY